MTTKTFPNLTPVKPEDLTIDEIRGLLGLFNDDGELGIVRGEQILSVKKSELREWFEKEENKQKI